MNVISTNCTGGWLYRFNNLQFNNPFIWMVTPYTSVKYMLEHYEEINWLNFDIEKSKIRPNTFIIKIDNKIEIHYVHYKFDPKANSITVKKKIDSKGNTWDGDIFYNHIWEYVVEKYEERTKRLLQLKEPPVFLISQESYANNNGTTLMDLLNTNSKYKRIFITNDKKINSSNKNVKIIQVSKIEDPEPTIRKYKNDIMNFIEL